MPRLPVTTLNVVNRSALVDDASARTMTAACAAQARIFAADHGLTAPTIGYVASNVPTAGAATITLLDDPDQANALGWHTEDQSGVYGRVFARPVLDNGGDLLHKPLSVASVLSHEVLELIADPAVATWVDAGHRRSYALEVCDPVESSSYGITVPGTAQPVTVSNYVLPAWFDAQAPSGPFDKMGHLTAPLTIERGGYVVWRSLGRTEHQIMAEHADFPTLTVNHDDASTVEFGPDVPAWRLASKVDGARTQRRTEQAT